MEIGDALDVVIGLGFLYFLLSLLVTVINELFASILKWRAATLKKGLKLLLDDPDAKGLYQEFWKHPLMARTTALSGSKGPSYISSANFASVLLDQVLPDQEDGRLPVGKAMESLAKNVPSRTLRELLEKWIQRTGDDYDRLHGAVAQWYDDGMERLAGTYRRKIQYVSLAVGAVLVVAFNADTFLVASSLWESPEIRAATVHAALSSTGPGESASLQDTVSRLDTFPVGWTSARLVQLGDTGHFLVKLVGLLVTVLAVSLGAPFWFNLIQKVGGIRSAGGRPRSLGAGSSRGD